MVSHRLIYTIALLFTAAPAWACSCLATYGKTVSEIVGDDVIIIGIATDATVVDNESGASTVRSRVRVLDPLGQSLPDELTVSSPEWDGANCGDPPPLGTVKLIHAYRAEFDGGKLWTGSCMGTPPSGALLDYLEQGRDRYIPSFDECESRHRLSRRERRNCRVLWRDDNRLDDRIERLRSGMPDAE